MAIRRRAVARVMRVPSSRLEELTAAGRVRRPLRDIAALKPPKPGPKLTEDLLAIRNTERY